MKLTIALLQEHYEAHSYIELENGTILDLQSIGLLLKIHGAFKKESSREKFEQQLNTDLEFLVAWCWSKVA